MTDIFKYHHEYTKEGIFDKSIKLFESGDLNLVRIHPLEGHPINGTANYSFKGENYEVAFSVQRVKRDEEKIKKGEKKYREVLVVMGTDFERDSDLINKLIQDLK
jgi:hypothetical protein